MRRMLRIIILVLISEIVTALGQVLFKKSVNSVPAHSLDEAAGLARFLKDALSKPMLWAGFAALVAGLLIWVVALAQGDLSLVFPLGSMQYLIILFSAHFFLGEKIDRMKLSGTLLVTAGIILITMS